MTVDPQRNSFRAQIFGGRASPLLDEKARRIDPDLDGLDAVGVPRSESRRGNHRDEDRHRLDGETALVSHEGRSHTVELINLSGGGAMIRADFKPRLWDMVELRLGEGGAIECAVRWIRDDRLGLEFAHETRIECDPDERNALLLEVIRRSFPGAQKATRTEAPAPATPAEDPSTATAPGDPVSATALEDPWLEPEAASLAPTPDAGPEHRAEIRHPMIWKGILHSGSDRQPVRLRNVSRGGALVHVVAPCAADSAVVLDLGGAGRHCATVTWNRGDEAGLRFDQPFDIGSLAKARPEVTPQQWQQPAYLSQTAESDSPWDPQWSRQSVSDLRSMLEGYMKY